MKRNLLTTRRAERPHEPRFRGAAGLIWLIVCAIQPLTLLAHGELYESIVTLSKRLVQEPENAELYVRRSNLYREHRSWRAAQEDFERAAQLDPELYAVDLLRGLTWFEAGRPALAKPALDRFLAREPQHGEALMTRARVLAALSDAQAAAADFTQVIAIEPTPDAYLERAQALVAADDGQIEEALRDLDESHDTLGPLVTLAQLAIELEFKRAHYNAALTRLDEIAATTARQDTWLAQRAEILEQAGHLDEARKAYEDALAALDTLPRHRRNTRASAALEDRVHAALARLSTAIR